MKVSDRKAQAPTRTRRGERGERAPQEPKSPKQLVKVELELGDGRYLLAYAAKDA